MAGPHTSSLHFFFFLTFYLLFSVCFVRIYKCLPCKCLVAYGGQKRALDPLELEIEPVFERVASAFTAESPLQPPGIFLFSKTQSKLPK